MTKNRSFKDKVRSYAIEHGMSYQAARNALVNKSKKVDNPASLFRPEWASPPGDTVHDILVERGWSYENFSSRMGWSMEEVHSLIYGVMVITEDRAKELAEVLGSTELFWVTRDEQYREALTRSESSGSVSD